MTITNDRREMYPNLTDAEVQAVNVAYTEMRHILIGAGIKTVGDDRAKNLVGAIARYVEDCKT